MAAAIRGGSVRPSASSLLPTAAMATVAGAGLAASRQPSGRDPQGGLQRGEA
jgi:hypothetical protein